MNQHRYTAEEIAELITLASEARELDAESREMAALLNDTINAILGEQYPGWEGYHPELNDLIDATRQQNRTAPFQYIPRVGEFAMGRNIRKPSDWRKLNNQCRREIAKARAAIAAHQKEFAYAT